MQRVTGGKVLEPGELPVAELLVERPRLEAERVEPRVPRAALASFRLRLRHQRPSQTVTSPLVGDPQNIDVQPAERRPSCQSCDDAFAFPHRNRERLVVGLAEMRRVERADPLDDLASGRAMDGFDTKARHGNTVQLNATFTELSGNSWPKQR